MQVMGHVIYLPPLLCVWNVVAYMHHQYDMCVTLLVGAPVLMQPFTQRLPMSMPFSSRVPHLTSPLLLCRGGCTLPIYGEVGGVVTYYDTVFASDTLLAIALVSPLSYHTGLTYTVQSSHSVVLCP